jgi:hypothetical protein
MRPWVPSSVPKGKTKASQNTSNSVLYKEKKFFWLILEAEKSRVRQVHLRGLVLPPNTADSVPRQEDVQRGQTP